MYLGCFLKSSLESVSHADTLPILALIDDLPEKNKAATLVLVFETDHKCSHPKTAGFYLTALSNRNTSVTAEPRSQTETILCSRHCTEAKVQIAKGGKGER